MVVFLAIYLFVIDMDVLHTLSHLLSVTTGTQIVAQVLARMWWMVHNNQSRACAFLSLRLLRGAPLSPSLFLEVELSLLLLLLPLSFEPRLLFDFAGAGFVHLSSCLYAFLTIYSTFV
jgi:hypothetical protein